jgi:lipopolysaccharide/colanic/teichoic acid biosynthesis glycosyltransferase
LAVCDFLILCGCFALAAWRIEPAGLDFYLFYENGMLQVAIAAAVIQLTLYFERMYERTLTMARVFQQVCLALGVAFLLQALLAYSGSPADTPRWIMIGGALLVLVAFPAWRVAASAVLEKALPPRKVLFLGAPLGAAGPVEEIAQLLKQQPEIGLAPVGYLGERSSAAAAPCLGSMDEFDSVLQECAPSRIVVQREADQMPVRRLLELQRLGTRVEELSNLYESVAGRVSAIEMSPDRLIFSRDLDSRRSAVAARDLYSVLASCLLLILTAPLLGLAALSIKRRSPGPVFERDPRVGLKGAPLSLFRFRQVDSAPLRWICKLRLGSLPRLLNAARGDLALVGPAPEHPAFAAVLRERIPFYGQRLSVKPGLTGWAQVHRNVAEMPDSIAELEYDLYYIKHLSPALDFYVLLLQLRKWTRSAPPAVGGRI